ncbi:tetratricopeptide repeat protein [Candidatus Methylobacter oryzae]|uniref:Tetratricopeptide repeat protein n=1 Tax=Candidatus Methylobacter oryzae TaxID=2497749 RepID=A0ABY3CA57_9GAMM|nr:hypothetical protein [Candidatus Methylobacter oryzae]TRW94894.1 hypothetical protein EKO24_010835 [Candidatus Methylobacter oryzae]
MLLNTRAFYLLLTMTAITSGCAYNVPLAVDPVKDMHQSRLVSKKMPIKVGIYLSDDLKHYVYKQQRMGTAFRMKIGKYLPIVAAAMASAMFDDVILVDSVPPYSNSYKPDVEAVIRLEILSCYANAVGDLSGYIKAKTKLRITAYDLDGNSLWQDEAVGESRSTELDFIGSLLDGMEEAGKTGYQAVFSATARLINDFYAKPPQKLLALLEVKKAENLRNLPNFELFKTLYEKGRFQYDKKNYCQSLYLFAKASTIVPDEPATLFYTGACYTHSGDKQNALKKFADIIAKSPSGQEASDAKKWIQRLNDPLKIGLANINKANKTALDNEAVRNALTNSNMYTVIDTAKLTALNNPLISPDFSQFLDSCSKKGAKVIILHEIDSSSQKASPDYYGGEDVATEHSVRISAKAYSTKRKQLTTAILINEKSSTMQKQTAEEEAKTKQQLLENASRKLVLQLLKNDIF